MINPTTAEIDKLFSILGKNDSAITLGNYSTEKIREKRLLPEHLSHSDVFNNLSAEKISVVRRERNSINVLREKTTNKQLVDILSNNDSSVRHRIRTSSKIPIYLSISDIMYLWKSPATKVHTTDVCVKQSRLGETINAGVLNSFNIFKRGEEPVSNLEMLALTVSTKGSITESHTDDSDGITHGIIGKKLWLAWDSSEGMQHGLEDSERIDSNTKPNFDLKTFLKLDSSRWFVVDEGTTLYLPGNMAHRVITLEDYIGLSSFSLSFPSLLNTLSKWGAYDPLFFKRSGKDAGDKIFFEIINTTLHLAGRLKSAPGEERTKWGFDYFLRSKDNFFKKQDIDNFINQFPRSTQPNLKQLLK